MREHNHLGVHFLAHQQRLAHRAVLLYNGLFLQIVLKRGLVYEHVRSLRRGGKRIGRTAVATVRDPPERTAVDNRGVGVYTVVDRHDEPSGDSKFFAQEAGHGGASAAPLRRTRQSTAM